MPPKSTALRALEPETRVDKYKRNNINKRFTFEVTTDDGKTERAMVKRVRAKPVLGMIVNENLARGLGIDSTRVRAITFGLGAGLACAAGALMRSVNCPLSQCLSLCLSSAFLRVATSARIFSSSISSSASFLTPFCNGLRPPSQGSLLLHLALRLLLLLRLLRERGGCCSPLSLPHRKGTC